MIELLKAVLRKLHEGLDDSVNLTDRANTIVAVVDKIAELEALQTWADEDEPEEPECELNVGDLTDEEWREYDIPGRRDPYTICNPQKLFTRPGGSTHCVLDAAGEVHYIPFPGNGTVLRWKPRDLEHPVAF